jgi:ubiquinone/menaquinone biosynthesis C-methylase UbiE
MIRLNGLHWTSYVVLYVILRKFSKDLRIAALDQKIKTLEKRRNLPGMNCAELNEEIWNSWDWEKSYGEEWTKSSEWKQSLVDHVMMKYFSSGKNILEIGPGAGKWTAYLQQIARHLTIVDISEKPIEICKNRFSNFTNLSYHTNDGSSLPFIRENSVDYIWSFDCFVHISPEDTAGYFREFSRILKNQGIAIIHHPSNGGLQGGWRSNVTKDMIKGFCTKNGLNLISQFNTWGSKNQFDVKHYDDTISVITKP